MAQGAPTLKSRIKRRRAAVDIVWELSILRQRTADEDVIDYQKSVGGRRWIGDDRAFVESVVLLSSGK